MTCLSLENGKLPVLRNFLISQLTYEIVGVLSSRTPCVQPYHQHKGKFSPPAKQAFPQEALGSGLWLYPEASNTDFSSRESLKKCLWPANALSQVDGKVKSPETNV